MVRTSKVVEDQEFEPSGIICFLKKFPRLQRQVGAGRISDPHGTLLRPDADLPTREELDKPSALDVLIRAP
ncbi:hypothetical protein X758_16760 [Mesorhizobium sp. LSHC416B00]|nr:hypothetical protein X761_30650 [Mesorhizobium sp. LSHC424B00]ESX70509.1 hypothetical protein X758_16760 [Mesorhizobium sp. LSHC416B00]ESZ40098.1 hypothetical protein X730_30225 [Mesorhizobium sp. L103C565B0]